MKTSDILKKIVDGFGTQYPQFKEFQHHQRYREYWNLCIQCVNERDLLVCILFCNNVFAIPPVKTFLTYYKGDLIEITGDPEVKLDAYTKRAIGAFWSMVFKNVFNLTEQRSVSVSMNDCFKIKTASVYYEKKDK